MLFLFQRDARIVNLNDKLRCCFIQTLNESKSIIFNAGSHVQRLELDREMFLIIPQIQHYSHLFEDIPAIGVDSVKPCKNKPTIRSFFNVSSSYHLARNNDHFRVNLVSWLMLDVLAVNRRQHEVDK